MASTCKHTCLMIISVLAGLTVEINPGLKIRISQSGLNYAASVGDDILAAKVKTILIPDQTGSAKVGLGNVDYTVTHLKVVDFKKPLVNLISDPIRGLLVGSINNAAISIHGDWSYKYYLGVIVIYDQGSVDAYADGLSASVSFSVGVDPTTGKPTISYVTCGSHLNQMTINLVAKMKWFYDLFKNQIEQSIRSSIEDSICVSAKKIIDDDVTKILATLPVDMVIDNLWLFDYRMVAPPLFASGYCESFHKGEFFFNGDVMESPYKPNPFAPATTTDGMITIWLSDYIFNTMGFVLFTHSMLHRDVTKNDLNIDQRGFLNTTCDTLICFGNLLPSVSNMFPNASIELELMASSSPIVEVTTSDVLGKGNGAIYFRARLSNGSLVDLFQAAVTVNVSLNVALDGMILKGKVQDIVVNITVSDSKVGPISDLLLTLVSNLAAEFVIIPKINEYCEKGFPIPYVQEYFRFNNTSLHLDSHTIRIVTDIFYAQNTTTLYFKKKFRLNYSNIILDDKY